jgi:hypothetical protein
MNERFTYATKEAAFKGDMDSEIRAVLPKGANKVLSSLADGYVFDDSSINTKHFSAEGNLGIVELSITETCMGALSLEDDKTMHMGLDEARELRQALDEAITAAEHSLLNAWETKEDLCPI